MKFNNAINNIPTVNSGGSVAFNLPVGIRYHGFNLYLSSSGARTAVNTTKLLRVRVLVDSTVLIDWNWNDILLYASMRGITLATGQIPIYFTDPLLVGLRNAYAGAIDTKQAINNVQVQVILGTVTTPSLSGQLIFDNLPNMKRVKGVNTLFNTPMLRYSQVENVAASANYSITDIPNGYPLDTLVIYSQTLSGTEIGYISYLTLSLNKVKIFEGTPADLADELAAYGIHTPTGAIILPFTYDRFAPVSSAQFKAIEIMLNCSTATAFGVTVQTQLPSLN